MAFCTRSGKDPFPAKEDVLVLFVSHLHMEKLAPGTIKNYLAAVRYEQICRILQKLRVVWDKSSEKWDVRMLWAASSLCFFGFLRSGEVVAPSVKRWPPQ